MSDFETMKVAELKKLAALYGINKDDIKGTGVNGRVLGTDYVIALNNYVKSQKKKEKTKETKSPKATAKETKTPNVTKRSVEETKIPKATAKTKETVKESKESVKESKSPKKSAKEPVNEPEDISVKSKRASTKSLNKKCGSSTMTNVDDYTKCDDTKICNIMTGNCVANTTTNKKGKHVFTVEDRTFVGDEKSINHLKSFYKKERTLSDLELINAFVSCILK